jgi:hypothetical protein
VPGAAIVNALAGILGLQALDAVVNIWTPATAGVIQLVAPIEVVGMIGIAPAEGVTFVGARRGGSRVLPDTYRTIVGRDV